MKAEKKDQHKSHIISTITSHPFRLKYREVLITFGTVCSIQNCIQYTCPEGKKSANISITILVSIKTTFPLCAGRDTQQPGGGAGPAPGEPAPPGGAPEARRQGKRSGRSRVRSLLQENQHLQEELQKLAANMRVTITMAQGSIPSPGEPASTLKEQLFKSLMLGWRTSTLPKNTFSAQVASLQNHKLN